MSHVVVDGRTSIGAGTTIYPFASIGLPPQHVQYRGEASRLVIGANNIIREHVTMHTGTAQGGMETRVGSHCFFIVKWQADAVARFHFTSAVSEPIKDEAPSDGTKCVCLILANLEQARRR
jgi:hypothetical protein